jgi:uncharacterized protein (DUF58 family)
LLEPDFLRRLERLRLLSRRRFAGTGAGTRRARGYGTSAEFADHRAYAPGDDVRRIDWNAYARLEQLVLRLFAAERDLTLYLLVDTSRSLAFGEPPKLDVARRIAAALGYIALSNSERVAVVPFSGGVGRTMPASRGKRRVGSLLRHLEGLEPEGQTDLERSVEQLRARRFRPGLVAVVSDFMVPGGWQRPLERLRAEGHEPALFHVLDRQELDPSAGGDFTLVDSERGTHVEVSLDERAVAAYRRRLRAFLADTEQWARRRGVSYVRVDGEVPLEDALLRYFQRGT